jgi:hypothetical protein
MLMRVQTGLDWDRVGGELRDNMRQAPIQCRKDLARMIGHIEALVSDLSGEEVLLRRTRKNTSVTAQRLLAQINEAILEYEKWLMLAHLQYG